MTTTLILGLVLTGGGLVAALSSELVGHRLMLLIGKPAASLGFLVVALASGALQSRYGAWILAGLTLSLLGDVLLMLEGHLAFLGGLVSFLLAHVAYLVAFVVVGVSWPGSLIALAGSGLVAVIVIRWLLPNVSSEMKGPVLAYAAVISVMVSLAIGTLVAGRTALIATGAALFYVSDLFVARERFVAPSPTNQMIGLPLYYAGQLLLALSVGA